MSLFIFSSPISVTTNLCGDDFGGATEFKIKVVFVHKFSHSF